jgi:hypothetical protein
LTQVTSTPNFVQVAAATPQNSVRTVGLPYPKAQSAGDLNVIVVGWNDTTSTITSLADSAGNAYKLAVPLKRSAHLSQAIYYASNIRGEASNSVTVTFDEAAEDVDLRVVEYAGLPGAVVLGSPASATGSDQIASTGGVSVTSTPALVFAAGTTVGSFTGPGGGYTSRIITQPDNDIVEDLVAHDSGIHTVTATQAGPTEWVMQAVAFSGTPVADAGAEHDSSLVHDTGVPDAVTRPSDAGGPPPSASYFVTQSGSGSRTGLSLDNAWSLATFNDTGSLKGGNAVFFSGTLTSPILPSSSGTPAAPLLLDFGTYAAAVESYFGVTSLAYVTIKGGTLSTSAAGGPDGALFDFLGGQSTHITIDGWTYAGPTDGVIDFSDQGDDGKCSYLTLSNNTVDNIAHFAQTAGSDNDGEVLLNNYARTSTNTVEQTDVIDIGAASNWLIQGNKLVNRAPGNQSSPAGNARHNDVIQAYSGGLGHIIRYNWIEQADSVGDGSNSWLMIEELTGSSTGAPSMELYSNVFVGSGTQGNGAAFDNNIGKFYCYNNTFIRLSTDASNTVRFLAPGIVYIRNNVMQWAINDTPRRPTIR